jgi:hypothetical protein
MDELGILSGSSGLIMPLDKPQKCAIIVLNKNY